MFSGNYLEKCSVSPNFNPGHVDELDSAMSNGEETSFQHKAGETQVPGNQYSKLTWLTQVDDDLERLMYSSVFDWKQTNYPAEITSLLMDASAKSVESNGKWIGLLELGKEWNV